MSRCFLVWLESGPQCHQRSGQGGVAGWEVELIIRLLYIKHTWALWSSSQSLGVPGKSSPPSLLPACSEEMTGPVTAALRGDVSYVSRGLTVLEGSVTAQSQSLFMQRSRNSQTFEGWTFTSKWHKISKSRWISSRTGVLFSNLASSQGKHAALHPTSICLSLVDGTMSRGSLGAYVHHKQRDISNGREVWGGQSAESTVNIKGRTGMGAEWMSDW